MKYEFKYCQILTTKLEIIFGGKKYLAGKFPKDVIKHKFRYI